MRQLEEQCAFEFLCYLRSTVLKIMLLYMLQQARARIVQQIQHLQAYLDPHSAAYLKVCDRLTL